MPERPPRPHARRRLLVLTSALTVLGLAAAAAADRWLTSTDGPDLGFVQLRLLYNGGVAFGLGQSLPAWVITAATAAIIAGLAGYAVTTAPHTTVTGQIGMAGVLAGAITNLIDRARDGVVTDYLHTGWFPTFNLPDVFITVGAALFAVATLTAPSPDASSPDETNSTATASTAAPTTQETT